MSNKSDKHEIAKPPLTPEQAAYEDAKVNQGRIIAFRSSITNSFVEMARLFAENRDKKYYKVLGCDTFEEWLGTPEISISRAYAYGLMKVHDIYITKYGMQPDEINVDISKLLMLNKLENKGLLASKEQAEEWVNKADKLSFSDLKIEVQEATGDNKEDTETDMMKKTECEPAWHVLKLRLSGMAKATWLNNDGGAVTCACGKTMTKGNTVETLLTGDSYALQAIKCDECKNEWLVLHIFE
jgi:hypothetical protein